MLSPTKRTSRFAAKQTLCSGCARVPSARFDSRSELAMDDLNKALGDISSIRRHVARATGFRGYGPATLAATGVLAILAGWSQASSPF